MSGSKSQSQQSSNVKSSSVGIGGDNTGQVISGDNNSITDYGAVSSAVDFANDSMDSLNQTTQKLIGDTISANNLTVNSSLDFGADVLDQSLSTIDNTINNSFSYADGVMNSSIDMISGNQDGIFNLVNQVIGQSQSTQDKILQAASVDSKVSSDVIKLAGIGVLVVGGMVMLGVKK